MYRDTWYILTEDHKVVGVEGCNAVHVFENWKNAHPELMRVAETYKFGRRVWISTVFLGIDHNFSDEGPPIVFETMVFGGFLDQEMRRASTWEEAQFNHVALTYRVERSIYHPSNYLKWMWEGTKTVCRGLKLFSLQLPQRTSQAVSSIRTRFGDWRSK